MFLSWAYLFLLDCAVMYLIAELDTRKIYRVHLICPPP